MLSTLENHRRKARHVLPAFVFDFIDGGAERETCLRANQADFQRIRLTPRILRDTRGVNSSVEVLGSTWRQPYAVAPMGLNGLLRPGGDGMLAQAAAHGGVPFILSTASNQRVEAVRAAAPAGELWLQLYVLEDRRLAEQLLRRARASDYRALVLTVDVPVGGHRWRDTHNGFGVPLRITPRLAWDIARHPSWALRQLRGGPPRFVNLQADPSERPSAQAQASLLARNMDRSLTWDSLRWLRGIWDGPLLLKGVLHPEDAKLAVKHGVDGIVVSNHGGRQLDAAPSTISVLPKIVESVHDRIPVLLDGGVRGGIDIIRAQSMGARAVLIGRPMLYGLAGSGQAGVRDVMRLFADEYERDMTLLGLTDPRALNPGLTDASEPILHTSLR